MYMYVCTVYMGYKSSVLKITTYVIQYIIYININNVNILSLYSSIKLLYIQFLYITVGCGWPFST